MYVYPRRSEIEKEVEPVSFFVESAKNDSDINETLHMAQANANVIRASTSAELRSRLPAVIDHYLDVVNAQQLTVKKRKVLNISRYIPSYTFTKDTLKKLFVKDVLNARYRHVYPTANWAYTNYNTLNFFTASTVLTSSALLYPNIPGGEFHEGYFSGTYCLSGAFSFDFYINPRYTTDAPNGVFKAGTIFHLSSSYALSLVSGSKKDENGRPVGFRMQLQLSHSADVVPSLAVPGTGRNSLTFLSDDNSLLYNNWHHVVVRWGTNLVNQGTGSFNIDGIDKGVFVVPSGTVSPRLFSNIGDPDVLAVGNYYEGINDGFAAQALFFATNPALRDGLNRLVDDGGVYDEPLGASFRHPLNAEIHDLAIKRYYMSNDDIVASASVGPTQLNDQIAFYLPPFFVQDTPLRRFVGDHGGILQTPFFEVDGSTDDPLNVAMSFGVAGHYINIENFVRDFGSNQFPRCHDMSGSVYTNTTDLASANDFLYRDKQTVRRNLFLLPCDDGNFTPSFDLLVSESAARTERGINSTKTKYVDDNGVFDPSLINLDYLISTASLLFGSAIEGPDGTSPAATYIEDLIGFSPEDPRAGPRSGFSRYTQQVAEMVTLGTYDAGVQVGAPLTIFQRTRDPSSNQVSLFNISNLYYGKRIHPGSFTLTEPRLSGSSGAIRITLKDDGMGNLYRADALTKHATWNSAGNLYYDEGIAVVKSPHLFFFGQDQFECDFRGEQGVHVLSISALAPGGMLNSSSNPNYLPLPASGNPNDYDTDYVHISGVNFHDENMNVIAKASLAQPITKRVGQAVKFRVRFDF